MTVTGTDKMHTRMVEFETPTGKVINGSAGELLFQKYRRAQDQKIL